MNALQKYYIELLILCVFAVFRLQSLTTAVEPSEDVSIFALASMEATESTATAHERDMVEFRDLKLWKDGYIEPADEVTNIPEHADAVVIQDNAPPSRSSLISGKVKATTAKSFFANHAAKSTKKSSANKKEETVQPTAEKENKINIPKKTAKTAPPTKKIGNADDFVADEEESDDEEPVARAPTKKIVLPDSPKLTKKLEKPPSSPVRGAMDTFASSKVRKRRKKMVTKTTMVGGYLKTESQAVWEEITSDEEREDAKKMAAQKKPKPRPKASAQGMKQKSIMGFFAKK